MRLPEKQLFGLPVTFDVTNVDGLKEGDKVLLRYNGEDVAVLEAESIYKPNKVVEAKECYGTASLEHPTVHSLIAEQGEYYLGGRVHGLQSPSFKYKVMTPEEVRKTLPEGKDVVAFQNRNPIHRAHFELLKSRSATSLTPSCSCTPPAAPRSPATSTASSASAPTRR
jgi:sulfate adenylyltransferase